MRRAARIDANQHEIVEFLRRMGASVYVLNDIVDLLVGWRGKTILAEVKDGNKPPSARKLTKREKEFKENWKGNYYILKNNDDAGLMLKDFK